MLDFSEAPAAEPEDRLTAIFARERAASAERAEAPDQLLQRAECFNDGTSSDTLRDLLRDMHRHQVPRLDVSRIIKVAAKRIGSKISDVEAEYGQLAPKRLPVATSADITTLSGHDLWDWLGLDQQNGHVLDNLNNAAKVLESDTRLAGHVWCDEFANRTKTDLCFDSPHGITIGPLREWSDVDDAHVARHMQNVIGMSFIRDETVGKAVRMVASRNRINPPRAWMESLVWDGVERLHTFLQLGFGAEQSDYHAAVGRCFAVSVVARVYTPGCKVDTVPVFESRQGAGKSQAIKAFGGEWATECHEQVTGKDFYQVLHGYMIMEIAELNAFNRAEVNRIKGTISSPVDRYRAPYERRAQDHPRQTVLVGTTNRDDWNTDDTGARRFWPVTCGAVDLEWIRVNRAQLFAEAVARFKRSEIWWDVPLVEAEAAQAARRPDDAWTDFVATYVNGGTCVYGPGINNQLTFAPQTEVMIVDILMLAIRIPIEEQEKRHEMRVASILTGLGWRRELKSGAGKRLRCWVRTTSNHLCTTPGMMDFSTASTL